ncbi:hypothetical protein V1477_008041 [Vespula maculifrons]|uniref:Uncharacterized protein n=1 Tax=Vespula maculifrons TaxID=7453 RepID=A0ABD2CFE4_VESMC
MAKTAIAPGRVVLLDQTFNNFGLAIVSIMTKVDSSRSVNAMNEKIWWVVRLMSGRVQARKLNIFYVRLSNQ